MMKKLLLGGIVIAAVVAGGSYYWFSQGAKVAVAAVLVEGGPDVTDLLTWDLDKVVGQEGGEGITFTYVETYAPETPDGHTYEVDPSAPVEVRAHNRGNVGIEEVVEPVRGQTVERTFVLDAGQVNATFQSSEGGQARLQIADNARGSFMGTVPDAEDVLFLSPGSYALEYIDGEITDVQQIDIAAGEVIEMAFDARTGQVRLGIDSPVAWPESLPPLTIALPDSTAFGGAAPRPTEEDGLVAAQPLKFGTHRVMIAPRGGDDFFARIETEAEVTVDGDGEVLVPLDFQVVRVNLPDLPANAERIDLRLIETYGKGEAVASLDNPGAEAVLAFDDYVFEPGTPFGLALWIDRQVAAITEIGEYAPGTETEVTVALGDGAETCAYLYGAETCAMD